MVLRNSGRVGRRRFPSEVLRNNPVAGDFVFVPAGRIPIESLSLPCSAFWPPHEALRHALSKCGLTPPRSAELHPHAVLRCIF